MTTDPLDLRSHLPQFSDGVRTVPEILRDHAAAFDNGWPHDSTDAVLLRESADLIERQHAEIRTLTEERDRLAAALRAVQRTRDDLKDQIANQDTAVTRLRAIEKAAEPWLTHPVNHLRSSDMKPCVSCALRDALSEKGVESD